MSKLGYKVYNLIPWYAPSKRPQCFSNGECSTIFTALCRKYKYIIIGDLVSDGYGYIINGCSSKVIFEITNRFDAFVDENIEEYHRRFGLSLNDTNKDISIVMSSPYEDYYACQRGVHIPLYHVIRSTGYIYGILDSSNIEKRNELIIVNRSSQDISISKTELEKRFILFKLISPKDCNINILSQYKAQLILPSHITNQIIMENFKYGIVMIVPSKSLFREIVSNINYTFGAKEILQIDDGLEKYTDWYNEEFKDLIIYFNSWDDIHNIMNNSDFDKIKLKAMKYAEEYEDKIIEQWKEVLNNEEKHLISHDKPICKDSNFNDFHNY
ncbi:hypothetical protein BCR32DRAFT_330173 [Anaeromyces robustus]|uniref:Uncharacterized protein n=1 Tax=Anaeromyces robustus TaxID=1754192 RepID=A0A1Y1W7W0_9FUNG|nr:hypothetical protein BCR32DRAFT_331000 [Anaeromyces robustus]ORX69316.1 hypothetical protein BCR32DRAFT_330173 [Anaeromyces robustus]|eukprot:ORX45830.1 hypothetical protein BCR32DRAFT_331000 [Anaeromyces robustus]